MGRAKTARNTATIDTTSSRSAGANVVPIRPTTAKPAAKSVAITHDQIAKRAHEIWVKRGCKHGTDKQNWLEAEAQLRAELAAK